MKKNKSARRGFIKLSAMGLGSLAIAPVTGASQKTSELITAVNRVNKKLNIVCVGAHPGDPEFGCGGTMAKYSDAGHKVTFLYLTRGEASDPGKSYTEMAALRTKEAEVSCRVLNATARFAGQGQKSFPAIRGSKRPAASGSSTAPGTDVREQPPPSSSAD